MFHNGVILIFNSKIFKLKMKFNLFLFFFSFFKKGHDFRPDYKKLAELRNQFPNLPIMALTATATPRVRVDILNQLKMKDTRWFIQSFNRTNLKFEVRTKKKGCLDEIIGIIQTKYVNRSGIIYCLSR